MPSYYGMVLFFELLTLLAKNMTCAFGGITPLYCHGFVCLFGVLGGGGVVVLFCGCWFFFFLLLTLLTKKVY